MRSLFPGRVAALLVVFAACTESLEVGEDVSSDPVEERIRELRSLWVALRPSYEGTPYLEPPMWEEGPYRAGQLHPDFIADGIGLLNFLRYTSGLPGTLRVDPLGYQAGAQHGAVLLARLGALTRAPGQPPDMDDTFFTRARNGIDASNLAAGSALASLEDAIGLWLDEGSPGSALLNRRWLLHPRMARTGFGYAEGYVLAHVLDFGRGPESRPAFLAWPAPLATPVEYFSAGSFWSVSLNPDVYGEADPEDVTVTVTRRADGRSWVLEETALGQEVDGSYLAVDGGDGPEPAVIFRPGSGAVPAPGETFHVRIQGLAYRNGEAATLDYSVTFFGLEG